MTRDERLAKQRESNKRYYAKNKEKLLAQHRQWRAEHPDDMRRLNATWYRANHERARAARRAWTARNPDYYRTWRLLKAGCPPEQYDQFLAEQGGVCAICRKAPKIFHIDHDHQSGKIRGLLCVRCNGMLGFAHDNPNTLRRGADYVEKHVAQSVGERSPMKTKKPKKSKKSKKY